MATYQVSLLRTLPAGADRLLGVLKWPVALASVILAPATGYALLQTALRLALDPAVMWPLFAGVAAYWVFWKLLFRRPALGSVFSTFEHELTHAVFALATFHRVVGMRLTWRDGGHVRYVGGTGNWLITIAPYWFNTFSVAVIITHLLLPDWGLVWVRAALGATVSYHAISTFRETHRDQNDLHSVGFPFAFAFLPAANFVSYGATLAYAGDGLPGLTDFLWDIWRTTVEYGGAVM